MREVHLKHRATLAIRGVANGVFEVAGRREQKGAAVLCAEIRERISFQVARARRRAPNREPFAEWGPGNRISSARPSPFPSLNGAAAS